MRFLRSGLAAAALLAIVLPAGAETPLTPTRPLPRPSHWLEPPPATVVRPARHVEHPLRYARHRRHRYRRHRHFRFAGRSYRRRYYYGVGYRGDPEAYVGLARLEASSGGP